MCHGSDGNERCEENKGPESDRNGERCVWYFTWADSKVLLDEVTIGRKLYTVNQLVS